MMKPNAVASAPKMTRAAPEFNPTITDAIVRMVASTRFIQICSA